MNTKDFKYIEKYAEEHNISLMEKNSIKFLTKFIDENNVKNILEIGTGVGYLALKLATSCENVKITTIEKDCQRYIEALKNIKSFELEKRITLVLGEALDLKLEDKYDLIIIDAAKGQYIKLFEKYSNNLKKDGVIISDNINYNNLMNNELETMDEYTKQIIIKIEEHIKYLVDSISFKTKFYKIGDGLSISRKVNLS